MARSRSGAVTRTTGAVVALVAAVFWVLDRLGVVTDPLAGVEAAAVAHPSYVVAGLALLAAAAWLAGRPDGAAASAPQVSARSAASP